MKTRQLARTDYVVDKLREAIAGGKLEAGDALRQDRIAAELGVSHIPVREAFRELVSEGLAVRRHNRGIVVSEMSWQSAWELTEFRMCLEPRLARWALPNLTVEQLDKAEGIAAEIEAVQSTDRALLLNETFHDTLYSAAERPWILQRVNEVRINMRRYLRLAWSPAAMRPKLQAEHREMIALCRQGDDDKLASLITEHVGDSGRLVVRYLKSQESRRTFND